MKAVKGNLKESEMNRRIIAMTVLAVVLFILRPVLNYSQLPILGDSLPIELLLSKDNSITRKIERNSNCTNQNFVVSYVYRDFVIYKINCIDTETRVLYRIGERWYYFRRIDYEFHRRKVKKMIRRHKLIEEGNEKEESKILVYVQYLLFWNGLL